MSRITSYPTRAFTLIELLVVIVIIGILIGLVLSISGYVINNAKKSRATGEVAALELALTRFQVDNGFYPGATNIPVIQVFPNYYSPDPTSTAPTNVYKISGRALFLALTGRTMYNYSANSNTNAGRQYIELKASQVGDANASNSTANLDPTLQSTYTTNTFNTGSYIMDPYLNPYGYYYSPNDPSGVFSIYNNTMPDIWSTVGEKLGSNYIILRWVHNWPQNGTP